MAMPFIPPQLQAEKRRGEIERVEAVTGGIFKVAYFLTVAKAGETSVDVNFPVWFTEMPSCSSGGSLMPGSVIEDGNYPWCSVMVGQWVRRGIYYVGATLILVLSGSANQQAVLHFQAEGKALQGPLPAA